MKVCGQTLILIDNDIKVSDVNRRITDLTLKYILENAPSDRAFSISTYSHRPDRDEDFTLDTNALSGLVEEISYEEKDSNLTDTLTNVINRWRESDFACRDIVVFTDGLEEASLDFEDEELFYVIKNTDYPIYVVYLQQDNNAEAKKHLSAIASVSDGKLILTEYPGDDAGVDKHIADELYASMNEYALNNWSIYEESQVEQEEDLMEEADEQTDEQAVEVEREELTEEVIFDMKEQSSILESPSFFLAGVLLFIAVIILSFAGGLVITKNRHKERKLKEDMLSDIKKSRKNVNEDEKLDDDWTQYRIPYIEGTWTGDTADTSRLTDEGATTLLEAEDDATTLLDKSQHTVGLFESGASFNKMISFDSTVVIGRSSKFSEEVVDDSSISKSHCKLEYIEGKFYIEDLNSANGTIVNGAKIKKSILNSGDILTLGVRNFRVECYE